MQKIIVFATAILLISSCATGNKVVSDHWIQKRKYQKGFYIARGKKLNQQEFKNTSHNYTKNTENLYVPVTKTIEQEPVDNNTILQTNQTASVDNYNPFIYSSKEKDVINNPRKNQTLLPSLKKEKPVLINKVNSEVKKLKKEIKQQGNVDAETILLYILAVLLPPLAVGLVTNWSTKEVLISILLWILFILPGVIYAIYMVYKNS